METVDRTDDATVVLSEPWTPSPWEGEPIRFLLIYDQARADVAPRDMRLPQLHVRVSG